MISFQPMTSRLRRLAGQAPRDFLALASERWEVAPAETRSFPPALFLPEALERIVATEFATLPETLHALHGDEGKHLAPTYGYRLRDVDLVDGVLYKGGAEFHLRQRRNPRPYFRRPSETVSGAMYETWVGNRWFGNWFADNCLSYPLAVAAGNPVTTAPAVQGHTPRYEQLLGMTPRRVTDAHFDELILFDDAPNNTAKIARTAAMRARLLAGRDCKPVPGVWLLRGRTGDQRLLLNEDEIAGRLADQYGFLVLDATQHSVDELLDLCGAARVIAGVEGSQLVHGMAVAPPGATLFTLQPPDRVTAAMKLMTDRLEQYFGLVVCDGDSHRFSARWDEVERTLALLP